MIKTLKYIFLFSLGSFLFFSCNVTKHLEEHEKLLIKNNIKIISDKKKEGISEDQLQALIIPRPNSKFLFMRLNLGIYNMYSPEKVARKEKKKINRCENKRDNKISEYDRQIGDYQYYRDLNPKKSPEYIEYDKKLKKIQAKKNEIKKKSCEKIHWTHKIGEAPVLYKINDEFRNKRQLRIFLKNKGYYHSIVRARKVMKSKHKAVMQYTVNPGKSYRIDTVKYKIDDEKIEKLIFEDIKNSFVKKGGRLDIDSLQNERVRIANNLRNSGYYKFTKKYVVYSIDTVGGVEVEIIINKSQEHGKITNHKTYTIKQVNVYPNFNPRKALTEGETYYDSFKKHEYRNNENLFLFYEGNEKKIRRKTISRGIYTLSDSIYRLQNVKDTYKYLTSMEIIKIANISFSESAKRKLSENDTIDAESFINCNIKITDNPAQSYKFEIEGTHTNGNLGAGGSLTYTHKNIFHGAEVFNLGLKGSLERQQNDVTESDLIFNSREIGVEAGIKIPRFLGLSRYRRFIKHYNPATEMIMNYTYLERPDYTRTVAGLSFGYKWLSRNRANHLLKPIILDYVDLENPTQVFLDYIARYNLQGSYEDHFIFGSAYSYIFNNSAENNPRGDLFFRTNLKVAGNSLFGIMTLIEGNNTPGKLINNNVFAQFAKADFDIRYYKTDAVTGGKSVFRLFSGFALPYGNLNLMPFGEKYFSGGANDIRAWQVRSLGPGSYSEDTESIRTPNQTADIKLEGNYEYRMKLFWMIEGAFFIDAGNIWAINEVDDRDGALFEFSDFYKEIAVGTGLGFRFDFDLVIVRIDFGLKIIDPAMEEGNRRILGNRDYNYNDWTFNFGIGYPF